MGLAEICQPPPNNSLVGERQFVIKTNRTRCREFIKVPVPQPVLLASYT